MSSAESNSDGEAYRSTTGSRDVPTWVMPLGACPATVLVTSFGSAQPALRVPESHIALPLMESCAAVAAQMN